MYLIKIGGKKFKFFLTYNKGAFILDNYESLWLSGERCGSTILRGHIWTKSPGGNIRFALYTTIKHSVFDCVLLKSDITFSKGGMVT